MSRDVCEGCPETSQSKHVDLKLVSRLEFGSGAVAMRYEPRR
jgi:hypothetical protein